MRKFRSEFCSWLNKSTCIYLRESHFFSEALMASLLGSLMSFRVPSNLISSTILLILFFFSFFSSCCSPSCFSSSFFSSSFFSPSLAASSWSNRRRIISMNIYHVHTWTQVHELTVFSDSGSSLVSLSFPGFSLFSSLGCESWGSPVSCFNTTTTTLRIRSQIGHKKITHFIQDFKALEVTGTQWGRYCSTSHLGKVKANQQSWRPHKMTANPTANQVKCKSESHVKFRCYMVAAISYILGVKFALFWNSILQWFPESHAKRQSHLLYLKHLICSLLAIILSTYIVHIILFYALCWVPTKCISVEIKSK